MSSGLSSIKKIRALLCQAEANFFNTKIQQNHINFSPFFARFCVAIKNRVFKIRASFLRNFRDAQSQKNRDRPKQNSSKTKYAKNRAWRDRRSRPSNPNSASPFFGLCKQLITWSKSYWWIWSCCGVSTFYGDQLFGNQFLFCIFVLFWGAKVMAQRRNRRPRHMRDLCVIFCAKLFGRAGIL